MSFDTAGRTMMGLTSAEMVAMVEALPSPAARLRGQLRRRRVRPAAHHPRLRRGGAEPADHRQGQRRHPEVLRRPHPSTTARPS